MLKTCAFISIFIHIVLGFFVFNTKLTKKLEVKPNIVASLKILPRPTELINNGHKIQKNNYKIKNNTFYQTKNYVENEKKSSDNFYTSKASLPMLLNKDTIKIKYPLKAKSMKIEGNVRLKIHIDKNGKVGEITILDGTDFGFYEASVRLAKTFLFEPAKDEEGLPKDSVYEHLVVFKLNRI